MLSRYAAPIRTAACGANLSSSLMTRPISSLSGVLPAIFRSSLFDLFVGEDMYFPTSVPVIRWMPLHQPRGHIITTLPRPLEVLNQPLGRSPVCAVVAAPAIVRRAKTGLYILEVSFFRREGV